MARIAPFRGFRFNTAKVGLGRALCPPYDVIAEPTAERLRGLPFNAIHLELPEGRGFERYRRAARLWSSWKRSGILLQDPGPAVYVCEERFDFEGKKFRRLGFFAALGLSLESLKDVLPHEKTLSAPKADRLKILEAVGVNFSPIFAVYPDAGGRARRILDSAIQEKPTARGLLPVAPRTECRLWAMTDPDKISSLTSALKSAFLLVADGHHRLGAARDYSRAHPGPGTGKILAYFCAELNPGLLVLPTHRIARVKMLERARTLCKLRPFASLAALLKALKAETNPYACGIFEGGGFYLAVPRSSENCRSRLGVEWIGNSLLNNVPPSDLLYSHDAQDAATHAKSAGGSAVFVKPFSVPAIRQAARRIGLLPQKSTYFYPKVTTGLVFNSLKAVNN